MPLDSSALASAMREATRGHISEETVKIRLESLLAAYLQTLGVFYESVHEQRTITKGRRLDALFGTVVIEYKQPHALARPPRWAAAVRQLQGYLSDEAKRTGLDLGRYVGILLDGQNLGFVRHVGTDWSVIGPEPINTNNVRLLLEYLRGLSRKPLDPERLRHDLGAESPITRQCVTAFWRALADPTGKTQMLYEEWKRLFGQVAGYGPQQVPELVQMQQAYGLQNHNDISRVLFAVHTYYALIIKLLAAEILTLVRRGIEHSFIEKATIVSEHQLKADLVQLEDGGVFRNLQIENLLEGDFFSWYLDIWNPDIATAVHQVLITLQEYEPSTTLLAPGRVKDLLKRLYQHLVPATLRHDLGEFYTPDWLAGWVLDKVAYDGNPTTRLLDPACGTGTFLVLAINRVRQYAKAMGMPDDDILRAILKNIVGFDLNPLAVVAARTNYILALGDLLEAQVGPVVIPIFMSDSIFSPSRRDTLGGPVCSYAITTQRGTIRLDIPASLLATERLAPMLAEVEACVAQTDATEDECLHRVAVRLRLSQQDSINYGDSIKAIYRQLAGLEAQQWNRIWARVIKNYFASASVGLFDIIAGNPPWLRWTRLPTGYRETIQDICLDYGLFSRDAYVGGIETDISTIVTYSAIDKWLKPGGTLGFLITQTVFKNESSEGFRKFRLPDGTPLQVLEVHDLVDVKPFENVGNRTAALFLRRGKMTSFPVSYVKWEKIERRQLPQDITLAQVEELIRQQEWLATPIYPNGGPWLTAAPSLLPAVQRMIGTSTFRARKGVTSDLNGVYWINVIARRADGLLHFRNCYDVGRHEVSPFEGWIEPGIVYPVVRGRDVCPFYIEDPSVYVVIPQDGMFGYPESRMIAEYPNALDYFRRYRQQLEQRASYKRYSAPRSAPYYSLWNVGFYSFARHKVAWQEVQDPQRFCASYVGPRNDAYLGEVPTILDHKLYFVACETAEEAHFLCAFLNSPAVRAFVAGYVIGTQVASHVTEYISIPAYDQNNPLHGELAHVSEHIAADRRAASEAEMARIEQIVEALLPPL